MRRALLTLVLALSTSPSFATGEIEGLITPPDRTRLAQFGATRSAAIDEARRGGLAEDVSTLDMMLAKEPVSFADFDMTGEWQCRTIKAGGPAPLVVYGWFRCRVIDDGSGWTLEKLTGSQRTKGRFFTDSDSRLTYLGSFYVAGEKAKPYGSEADSDQAGYAFRSGPNEWRIEFPAPRYESKFDILEFKR
ncbi:DUF4893 domain-containing protein [Pseudaminobacter arsenicus]|uniref:DUF4893 domain-containing protein n=1 Tax=Borborobacter arsenicus TaxID=1851146 RepID=A0A432VC35_9HYPH|nr:DUF4893 domain-containing protein [Pseudaminobacter arsenicus]RUM99663.1 DUF4893 domain-containing protein [Pseudaminobacter arsenicus]